MVGLYKEIKTLVEYVSGKEEVFLGDAGGWETFVNGRESQFLRAKAGIAFWMLFLLGTGSARLGKCGFENVDNPPLIAEDSVLWCKGKQSVNFSVSIFFNNDGIVQVWFYSEDTHASQDES